MRGGGLPGRGLRVTVFPTSAPSFAGGTRFDISSPCPNVPDAHITGLRSVSPASGIERSTSTTLRILAERLRFRRSLRRRRGGLLSQQQVVGEQDRRRDDRRVGDVERRGGVALGPPA